MNSSRWLLIFFWIIYYVVHSLLASTPVKVFFENKTGKWFRYYRLFYTIFATFTLGLLLYFQFSINNELLIKSVVLKYISLIFLVTPGIIIMIIAIKKYFMLLSGIRSVFLASPPDELKIEGIHRIVRHPLYSGTILFVWGLFFIFPLLNNLIAVILLTLYVLIGIKFEEKKLIKEFGKKYEEYIKNVPGLIPNFKSKK